MLALAALVSCADASANTPGETYIIPAATLEELTPSNGWPAKEQASDWTRSLGGPTSNRYANSTQITRENVSRLQVAWTYRSGDGPGNVQCSPIIVGSALFTATSGHHIVRLDAATGREQWRFKPEKSGNRLEDLPARRGLIRWAGGQGAGPRLFVTAGNWIYALDPETGNPIPSFGTDGRTPLPMGAGATGAVWQQVLVVPGFDGDVFGYDAADGRMLWRFHTIPRPGEFGHDTWTGQESGANSWGGLSLDESRGIVYVATGSPKPNFVGTGHLGQNLFSNCIIALEAATGKRLWHFQEIAHDIWDMDIPAPPNLVTVQREGRSFDAVAQVTKLGNTLLLDRLTGKPLFNIQMRRAPASTLPGEETWPYQPDIELPQPFSKQAFDRADITDRTPEATAHIEYLLARANMGWFQPFELARPTAFFGVLGGAEWTGAAFDPATNRLYVSANHMPYIVTVFRDDDPPPSTKPTRGHQLYNQLACVACHGANLKGTAMVPPLRGLRHHSSDAAVTDILKNGRNGMPPAPPMSDADRQSLLDYLFARDREATTPETDSKPRYSFNGYNRMLDHEGYPGSKPPWGTLNCINLNTGRLEWRIPLGEFEELAARGVPKTGTLNMGGAMVTAGGLVFCSGTSDRKIRAFDSSSGRELWSHTLPFHGTAPPASYEINGRQYIVLPATGGGKLGGPTGDTLVAFALPGN